jgi:ORF6N domain-containing protein
MGNQHLQPVEHNSQRILTTAQIAAAYGVDAQAIHRNFNRNKDRYVAGKHYFLLEGNALKQFKADYLSNWEVVDPRTPSLYLWTEKGALLHAKSLNTDLAWEAYELLVDEYYRLRERPQTPAPAKALPTFNRTWEQRLILFNRTNKLPLGYWCLFAEVGGYCFMEAFRGKHLTEESTPDISVGLHWCPHLRAIGYDMSRIKRYRHSYPDQRGAQMANMYPDDCLPEFRRWFSEVYLPGPGQEYFQTHQLQLPDPSKPKRLPPPDDQPRLF